ncbi:uncharacterized protein PG986_015030 [Apiospora aurea]|uniref:Uncharacterized protein n=1 Tax=Apiospora aurea TaxID=335848 RepID=A0ABR1PRQ2_9PEZI
MSKDSVNRTYDLGGMIPGAPLWAFKVGGSVSWRGDEFDAAMRLVNEHCKPQTLIGRVKMDDQGKLICKTMGGG